ncbi:MAG TPA: glycosyltransferase [Candidatus Onthomorpha intestinigallinarum]|uniref:Glycosyltransferase n=1 Tax=Candidatus Onthomorpha intestinigallinarum TaxID=2840880 RepID=A0A9D1UI48_9BACT|nr:glycosyltransferase [Candidatus Onthomorpha intestinigallinarum]
MNCKRILFLSPNLGSGGAERQMVTIASLFKDKGYDVEFLCYSEGNFYEHILKDKGITVHWIIQSNYLKRMFTVRRFIRKGGYNAIVSFLQTPNFLNNFAAVGGKKWKVIIGKRSIMDKNTFSKRGKFFIWFQRYSDAIVCNSENVKGMWLRYYPRYKNKLRVIYNTVVLHSVSTEYIPKRDGRLYIVVAASYQYLKNPIGVVNALALMNNEEREKIRIDWYGRKEVVRGDTRAYDEAIELIKQHGLGDVIELHEDTKDIHSRMHEADMIGLFSSNEGLPNAICEGMSLGKPVIMSKVSDYDVLIDESNGFLCDWDSAESIRDVFIKASSLTIDKLVQMGECSRHKAERLFENASVIDKWIDVVNSD